MADFKVEHSLIHFPISTFLRFCVLFLLEVRKIPQSWSCRTYNFFCFDLIAASKYSVSPGFDQVCSNPLSSISLETVDESCVSEDPAALMLSAAPTVSITSWPGMLSLWPKLRIDTMDYTYANLSLAHLNMDHKAMSMHTGRFFSASSYFLFLLMWDYKLK